MTAIEILKEIISEKQEANPRLSLRAIATKMEIPSGRLSELLNEKRRLTEYYLDRFCLALKISPDHIARLRTAFYEDDSNTAQGLRKPAVQRIQLKENQLKQLSSWKPYAILSFFETVTYEDIVKNHPDQDTQIDLIANQMQIGIFEMTSLILSLMEVNLIRRDKDRWISVHSETTTGYDIPCKYIQDGHNNDLKLSADKLFAVDIAKRDFSSVTLTIDPAELPKAKTLIRTFRRDFTKLMEKGSRKDVYKISIQFYPLIESESFLTSSKENT